MFDLEDKMKSTIEALERNLATIRTGRANPKILDKVMVSYYGALTPLNQLATVSVPEARQLLVKPFDKGAISDIEKGINEANLGLIPNNDGYTIRITIPQLTEERRKELVKQTKAIGEEAKVGLRNHRHELLNKFKNEDELSEDEMKQKQNEIQKVIDKYNDVVDNKVKEKEAELMTV